MSLHRSTGTLTAATLCLLAAGCDPAAPNTDEDRSDEYRAEIRWTSFGIPHINAEDWGSLGYGFAYATATDAICVIARDVMVVNGELSLHLGPANGNLESDIFHRAILTGERLARFGAAQPRNMREFSGGYVAGYNRYLGDHGTDLPASCAGKPWVRPIDAADIARLTVSLGVRYGLGQFDDDMARARPPGQPVAAGDTVFQDFQGLGSNGVALGRAATESGRGILFGNPHYPWRGSSRFHIIHTTIPGELDSMGASLYTTNFVTIGFNKDIAWTHTVSTARRFTIYALELDPADPMRYRFGDETRPIEARTVTVEARDGVGEASRQDHTVYFTHHGPVVASDRLPWTDSRAYAIRDVVLDNTAATRTYAALNKATSVDEVEAAISEQGVYWTNTIAADRHGTAFYADISSTPNIDVELLDRCRVDAGGIPAYVIVLDGSDPACEWKNDPRSKVPGALPAEEMPRIRRDDFVTNSNDSYWLANPDALLEGYSPVIGPERTARSLRTRAGLAFVGENLADDGRFTPEDVRNMLYSHRNFGAELFLDDVLEVCDDEDGIVDVDDDRVDIAPVCEALRNWDRTANVDSVGAHVWTEFWRIARNAHDLYSVPFDPEDPVNTPRGINAGKPEVALALRKALARSQVLLEGYGIPVEARWGDIQYAERNGQKIPIPGGEGWAGMFSMIVARPQTGKGYTPIIAGNSYIHVVTWDDDGNVDASGMLTYSQSQEPESAHYSDLTELYSRGEWIEFPFTEEQILADPNLESLTLCAQDC